MTSIARHKRPRPNTAPSIPHAPAATATRRTRRASGESHKYPNSGCIVPNLGRGRGVAPACAKRASGRLVPKVSGTIARPVARPSLWRAFLYWGVRIAFEPFSLAGEFAPDAMKLPICGAVGFIACFSRHRQAECCSLFYVSVFDITPPHGTQPVGSRRGRAERALYTASASCWLRRATPDMAPTV
jgi:hypothetical protein